MQENDDDRDDDRSDDGDVWWNGRWEEGLEHWGKQPWLAVVAVLVVEDNDGGQQQTTADDDGDGRQRWAALGGEDRETFGSVSG